MPPTDTVSSPPAPAGALGCGSADLRIVLLYQNLSSSGLEFCPVSLTANLVQERGSCMDQRGLQGFLLGKVQLGWGL